MGICNLLSSKLEVMICVKEERALEHKRGSAGLS